MSKLDDLLFRKSLLQSLPTDAQSEWQKYHFFTIRYQDGDRNGSFYLHNWDYIADYVADAYGLKGNARQWFNKFFLRELYSNISLENWLDGEAKIDWVFFMVNVVDRAWNGGPSSLELPFDERKKDKPFLQLRPPRQHYRQD